MIPTKMFLICSHHLPVDGRPAVFHPRESRMYRSWGADVIGITGMSEARLAREAELCYASVAMVTDYDCWHETHGAVDVAQVIAVVRANANSARGLVAQLPGLLDLDRSPCPHGCDRALEHALITAPDKRDRRPAGPGWTRWRGGCFRPCDDPLPRPCPVQSGRPRPSRAAADRWGCRSPGWCPTPTSTALQPAAPHPAGPVRPRPYAGGPNLTIRIDYGHTTSPPKVLRARLESRFWMSWPRSMTHGRRSHPPDPPAPAAQHRLAPHNLPKAPILTEAPRLSSHRIISISYVTVSLGFGPTHPGGRRS